MADRPTFWAVSSYLSPARRDLYKLDSSSSVQSCARDCCSCSLSLAHLPSQAGIEGNAVFILGPAEKPDGPRAIADPGSSCSDSSGSVSKLPGGYLLVVLYVSGPAEHVVRVTGTRSRVGSEGGVEAPNEAKGASGEDLVVLRLVLPGEKIGGLVRCLLHREELGAKVDVVADRVWGAAFLFWFALFRYVSCAFSRVARNRPTMSCGTSRLIARLEVAWEWSGQRVRKPYVG
jgi:hypothetical protein